MSNGLPDALAASLASWAGGTVRDGRKRCWIILREETEMGFGRGILLWMLGIPLPIIILLALFWR